MAIITEPGSITWGYPGGSKVIALSKFASEPIKAIIFFGGTYSYSNDGYMGFGFTTGASEEGAMSLINANGQGTTVTNRGNENNRSGMRLGWFGTPQESFELTSFGTNQFTINQFPNVSQTMYFVAIGGSDLTDAIVIPWTSPTSADSAFNITGTGWTPTGALTFGTGQTGGSGSAGIRGMWSMWDGTNERTLNVTSQDSVPTSRERHSSSSDAVRLTGQTGTILDQASFNAFNSDGAQLNFTTADANAYRYYTLFLQGAACKVGDSASPTSPSTVSIPLGFPGDGSLLFSGSAPGWADTDAAHAVANIGTSDGTTHRANTWACEDALDTANTFRVQDASNALNIYNASLTLADTATVAFSGNDLDAVFSAADGTARGFSYFAWGVGGPSGQNAEADLTAIDYAAGDGSRIKGASADLTAIDYAAGDGTGTTFALADLTAIDYAAGSGAIVHTADADLTAIDYAAGDGTLAKDAEAALTATDYTAGDGTRIVLASVMLTSTDYTAGDGSRIKGAATDLTATDYAAGLGVIASKAEAALTATDYAAGDGFLNHAASADLTAIDFAAGLGGIVGDVSAVLTATDFAAGSGTVSRTTEAALTATDFAAGSGTGIVLAESALTVTDFTAGMGLVRNIGEAHLTIIDGALGDGSLLHFRSAALTVTDIARGNGQKTVQGATSINVYYPKHDRERFPSHDREYFPS